MQSGPIWRVPAPTCRATLRDGPPHQHAAFHGQPASALDVEQRLEGGRGPGAEG
jgi:hypothetical protein